jgi:hypothetical protein
MNNVNWMMSSLKATGISDIRKILPVDQNFKDSLMKGTNKIVDSVTLKQQQFKKMQMAKKIEKKDAPVITTTKSDTFSSQIRRTCLTFKKPSSSKG